MSRGAVKRLLLRAPHDVLVRSVKQSVPKVLTLARSRCPVRSGALLDSIAVSESVSDTTATITITALGYARYNGIFRAPYLSAISVGVTTSRGRRGPRRKQDAASKERAKAKRQARALAKRGGAPAKRGRPKKPKAPAGPKRPRGRPRKAAT